MTRTDAGSGDIRRYTTVAVALHWSIALLILFNLAIGFIMEGLPPPLKGVVVPLHISAGITVLTLTMARVAWRLLHRPPEPDGALRPWERAMASIVHFLLYLGMILMPLIGWSIISANPPANSPGARAVAVATPRPTGPGAPGHGAAGAPRPTGTRLWWLIPLPPIQPIRAIGQTPGGVAPQRALHDEFVDWHAIGAYLLMTLVALHVAGALKHQLWDRQREIQRMWFRPSRTRPVRS